jgi:glycosyltransferase involved in cell wall biosynthesis
VTRSDEHPRAFTRATKGIVHVAMSGIDPGPRSMFVDRKFHVGMVEYARRLDRPLACLVPRLSAEERRDAIDHVDVPLDDLPYAVHVIPSVRLDAAVQRTVRRVVGEAALVYVGTGGPFNLFVAERCRSLGVPYVLMSEITLRNELEIMRATTSSAVRRLVREARLRLLHRRKLRAVAGCAELHANGPPTLAELGPSARSTLLYFDTRALDSDVVPEPELEDRLGSLGARPPRLLFSGRYHAIKGVLDVIRVGLELDRRGLDFRLDLYGKGPLRDELVAAARAGRGKIAVHGAVPYRPDLIEATRRADLALICHPQGDPSCTYLETFACGVPVAGYANEMWAALCRTSGGGRAVRTGDHRALAAVVEELLLDREALRHASVCARRFAAANTMERTWDRRAARLVALASAEGADAFAA